ncbi:hypothetical protein TELCIR_26306, partial [Teladorsagia circumcincta]
MNRPRGPRTPPMPPCEEEVPPPPIVPPPLAAIPPAGYPPQVAVVPPSPYGAPPPMYPINEERRLELERKIEEQIRKEQERRKQLELQKEREKGAQEQAPKAPARCTPPPPPPPPDIASSSQAIPMDQSPATSPTFVPKPEIAETPSTSDDRTSRESPARNPARNVHGGEGSVTSHLGSNGSAAEKSIHRNGALPEQQVKVPPMGSLASDPILVDLSNSHSKPQKASPRKRSEPCSPARRIEADVEPLPESRVETKIELSKKSAFHNECLVSKEIVSMKAEITVEAEVAAALKKSVVPAECPEVSIKVETEENSTVPCSTHAIPIVNEPVLSAVTQNDVGLTYENNVETATLSIGEVDAVEPKVSDDLKEKIKSAIAGREVLTSARNGRGEGEKMKRGVLVTPKTLPVKRDGSDLTPLLPSEKGQSTPEKKTSRIEAFEKDQRRVNGTPYKVAQAKIKTESSTPSKDVRCPNKTPRKQSRPTLEPSTSCSTPVVAPFPSKKIKQK